MYKILIVEDDKEILETYKAFFPKTEFKVFTAQDGLEGLLKFKNDIFDTVITDINLPKKNGISLIKDCIEIEKIQVANHNERKGKCVYVIASGFIDHNVIELANAFNITTISKPFDCNVLVELIKTKVDATTKKYNFLKNESFILCPGELLLKQNDQSSDVYYVWEGKLDVFIENENGENVKIGEVLENEFIGELSFFGVQTRSATVIAAENCKLSLLPPEMFKAYFDKQPKWAKQFVQGLVRRLLDHNNYKVKKSA
ncbi:MAG: cyclic nucleotide-binding domain-containing protein [Bacteriovoracaceae bacterium]